MAFDLLALINTEFTPAELAAFAAEDARRDADIAAAVAENAAAFAAREAAAAAEAARNACPKCKGSGRLGQYHYVQGGVCFPCAGTGIKGYARFGA